VFIDDLAVDDIIAKVRARPSSEAERWAQIIALFAPDQPAVGGLTRWGARIVIGRGPCVLELARATSARIAVPGLDVVQSVGGDAVRYAGGLRGGRVAVLREHEASWEPLPLPASLDDAATHIELIAGGESVVVWWGRRNRSGAYDVSGRHWWTGQRWITLDEWAPFHVVSPERILLGSSRGEWGGDVWSVLPDGSKTEVGPRDGLPVQALVPLPGGRTLVGTGLAHRGLLETHVGVLESDGTWRPLVRSSVSATYAMLLAAEGGVPGSMLRHDLMHEAIANENKYQLAWNLAPDALVSLDVDAQGRPHLLLRSQGVVRLDGDRLTPVTLRWPGASLYGACLLVDGEFAVIAAGDRGVLRWKLGTDQACRFAIDD